MHIEESSEHKNGIPKTTASSMIEILQRLEHNQRQVQRQISDTANIIAEGQHLLRRMSEAPGGSAPYSSEASPRNGTAAQNHDLVLRVNMLGRFELHQGSRMLDKWNNSKAKGILKLLIINLGKPLPKDVFIEAFWPNSSVKSANNSFRVAMHDLRQTLGMLRGEQGKLPYFIISSGSNYLINFEERLWVDMREFEAYWQSGRNLEKSGSYVQAMADYEKAERLYRGDFLEEDLYEEWTIIQREELLDKYLAILGKLTEFNFNSKDYESTVEYCQKILDKDSCREDAYQRLIVCYMKMNQSGRAMRWYELCEETLRRELNIAVSPETARLRSLLINP